MFKVSIIIPVYKAEFFLNQCLDSIANQTFSDWECLLIDDGSPDKSGSICDEYAKKDNRFKVFHVKNGGVSKARNIGLDNTFGEWIMFVDADDQIHESTLSDCIEILNKNDVDFVQFSFSRKFEDLGKKGNIGVPYHLEDYLRENDFSGSVWGCFVKSSIIKQHNILFDESMKLAEDQLFIYRCMSHCNLLLKTNSIYYYYYDNKQSATNNEISNDIIISANKCVEFKAAYPLFSNRMDDLVLFFIEKLCLRFNITESVKLLRQLKPTYYYKRPVCSQIMVHIGRFNEKTAILFEIMAITLRKMVINFIKKINKNTIFKQ